MWVTSIYLLSWESVAVFGIRFEGKPVNLFPCRSIAMFGIRLKGRCPTSRIGFTVSLQICNCVWHLIWGKVSDLTPGIHLLPCGSSAMFGFWLQRRCPIWRPVMTGRRLSNRRSVTLPISRHPKPEKWV